MSYPRLKINLSGIERNCLIINDRCTSRGITVVGVLKCVLGDPKIAEVIINQGIKIFGDSRLANLSRLRKHFGDKLELILLRTPMISEIGEMLNICRTSMNTQKLTVKKISEACAARGFEHNIIIMVETDDKREGLLPEEVLPFCEFILSQCPNINIQGLGTNARCISDKKPRPESQEILIELADKIQSRFSIRIPVISGGNSSVWNMIENDSMPEGVNQVRIGEAILFGHETAGYSSIAGASSDAFMLEAEVIEVKKKDNGIYKLIIALGLQDVHRENIFCKNPNVYIIDQSSDHTVMAINEDSQQLREAGDILAFGLNYFGLLSCMTSPFVNKVYFSG